MACLRPGEPLYDTGPVSKDALWNADISFTRPGLVKDTPAFQRASLVVFKTVAAETPLTETFSVEVECPNGSVSPPTETGPLEIETGALEAEKAPVEADKGPVGAVRMDAELLKTLDPGVNSIFRH